MSEHATRTTSWNVTNWTLQLNDLKSVLIRLVQKILLSPEQGFQQVASPPLTMSKQIRLVVSLLLGWKILPSADLQLGLLSLLLLMALLKEEEEVFFGAACFG